MSTTIDIDDIKDANSNVSAMVLTQKWAQTFQKYALEDTENLSDDPAQSFNIFLHLTAQGAAKMMYEGPARINEVNESTAILPKSLLNKLTVDELTGVFGFPSSMTLAFCIKKSDIMDYSIIADASTNTRRLKINKGLMATFESYPSFTLPYDVIVDLKPLSNTSSESNIYAYYDMPIRERDGMRSVYDIQNPYISSREMRFEGHTYIVFFLRMYQITRKEISFYVSDPNTSDSKITFEDSLVGFEVFRTKASDRQTVLMSGFTDGTPLTTPNCYNYSYDYKRSSQTLNINFSKMGGSIAISPGDTIKIIVYSTKGKEGNIKFPYMIHNLHQLMINYNQTLSDAFQNAMLNIVCLAFARDSESINGTDQLSLEQIRQKIINKKYSRNILITLNEIQNKAAEYGLNAYKEKHNILNLYIRGVDKLTYKDMILSTGMNNFYFDISKKKPLLDGYNYYLFEPTDVFVYDKENKRYNYKPPFDKNNPENNLETYLQYVEEYNTASDIESIMQVSFPFYMRYENNVNPKIQIYDMNVQDLQYLAFTDYKEDYALDKLDISYLKVMRNPFMGSHNGTFDKDQANTYFIQFIVHTGTNTLNKIYLQAHDPDESKNYVNSNVLDEYNKQYILFTLKMIGVGNRNSYQIDPTKLKIINTETMLTDGYIAYQATITTNNFITTDKQIQMRGIRNLGLSSINYNTLVPIDTSVIFELSGKFNDDDVNPNKVDCIKYESETVKLVDYITDYFGIDFDIETSIPGYETYEENIPYRYESHEFVINENYNPENTDTSDTDHYEYEIEVDNNNVPIFYNTNDGGLLPKYKIAHMKDEIRYKYILVKPEDEFDPLLDYFILVNGANGIYERVEIDSFEPETEYYTAEAELLHKKGEYKYYNKNDELVNLPDIEAKASVNNVRKHLPVTYTGVMKNVSWINRLYFSSEDMYLMIRERYLDLMNRVNTITSSLFDGGLFHAGLKRTSGNSRKYKAYKMSTNSFEYIKNIALKLTFRVRFKENGSIEYKKNQIINTTVKHIENLGDDNLSIDGLFEDIKAAVPDIDYINIVNINDYYNGEVQTIMNDISVTDEVLTVSQRIVTNSDGDIDFEPDITVNIVNTELV